MIVTEPIQPAEQAEVRQTPRTDRNLLTLFAVAFVVALIATGIFYGLFVGHAQTSPQGGPTVVVAAKSLDRGAVLKQDDLKSAPYPDGREIKGAFASPSQLVGATVLEPIQAGEPVTQARIAPRSQGSAESVIPKGLRALSLHVIDSGGVISMLRSGQRVDVQMITGTGAETQLRTVLQNVEVLNVPAPENGRPVVNVLVKPEDAETLALADSAGRIRIALRHPKDDSVRPGAPLSLTTLLRSAAPARRIEKSPELAARR